MNLKQSLAYGIAIAVTLKILGVVVSSVGLFLLGMLCGFSWSIFKGWRSK